jgi:hypothetical protein
LSLPFFFAFFSVLSSLSSLFFFFFISSFVLICPFLFPVFSSPLAVLCSLFSVRRAPYRDDKAERVAPVPVKRAVGL